MEKKDLAYLSFNDFPIILSIDKKSIEEKSIEEKCAKFYNLNDNCFKFVTLISIHIEEIIIN